MSFEMIDTPDKRLPKPIANPFAIDAPIMSELARPGPLVAANASISENRVFAALASRGRAAAARGSDDCATRSPERRRHIFHGLATCDATSSQAIRRWSPRKIATAVSSHEVSMARTVTGGIVGQALRLPNSAIDAIALRV